MPGAAWRLSYPSYPIRFRRTKPSRVRVGRLRKIGEHVVESIDRPYYRMHVFVCVNTRPQGHPRGCCAGQGAEKLRDYMKVRVKELGLPGTRINAAGCLDRCELGPTLVIYPEGVWYGYRSREDIDEILQTHLVEGGRVERLLLHPDQNRPSE
jgi:(2Fe-2S) ferredoxin